MPARKRKIKKKPGLKPKCTAFNNKTATEQLQIVNLWSKFKLTNAQILQREKWEQYVLHMPDATKISEDRWTGFYTRIMKKFAPSFCSQMNKSAKHVHSTKDREIWIDYYIIVLPDQTMWDMIEDELSFHTSKYPVLENVYNQFKFPKKKKAKRKRKK